MRLKRIALIIAFLILPAISFGFEQVEFSSKFGQRGSGPGQLNEPTDLAIDSEGIIYVADQGNKKVHVLGKDGRTIATWQSRAVDRWKLGKPTGIAVFENRVYVTDSYNDKVLIFFKNGKFVDEFGGSGSGPKEFSKPHGICVHQGVVYVADTGNDRVQKFSLDGIYLGSIGKKGDGIGEMRSPTDVAVDAKGYIYVSEADNDRIGVFLQSGHHYRYYYEIKNPTSVAVDDSGFFVADAGNYKIKKFNLESRMLLSFGTKGNGNAQFRSLAGIALDNDGNIVVLDTERNDIQVFSPEKKFHIGHDTVTPPTSVKWVNNIKANVTDMVWRKDRVYATSEDQDALLIIQKRAVRRVIKGRGNDELSDPHGITVDSRGYIWIADSNNDRIVKTDPEGKVIFTLGKAGSKETRFSSPKGVAVSPKGFIYVADTGNEMVKIFNTKGIFISKIEKIGRVDFDEPVDIDIDRRGNIYVVDKGYNSVAKYDASGTFLMYIGGKGEADGRFNEPTSAAVIGNELFVVDSGNNRVQVFTLKGKYLRKFGAPGSGKGDLQEPVSITNKYSSTIFIADSGNGRVQELMILRTPKTPVGVKAESGLKDISLEWKANKEPYMGHYRVYRSENKMSYKIIASPPKPHYVDKDVEKDTTYYYKISAVAKYGNESLKSADISVKTKKLLALPPTDIKVTPDEREIEISWKPAAGESSVSSYVIYREVNGEYKEIGKVKTTSYKDKGLEPDTKYSYKITALSPNNEESSGVLFKVATIVKPIDITVLKIHDVFPRAYKVYEKDGIGRIRLKNNTKKLLEDVLVSFKTREFMDKATVMKVGDIMPEDSIEIDVKPVSFNERIMTLKENTSLNADIKVVFYREGKKSGIASSHKLMVILTGRQYSKSEIKRFRQAMKALDDKVAKTKMVTTVMNRIKKELDTSEKVVKKLKKEKLSYAEIAVCVYISNETDKKENEIVSARKGGQDWQDIMSIFDLSISSITDTLKAIEKSLIVQKRPKSPKRQRATDRYVK
jgi:sugar lactone lactonase YvrE